MINASHLILGGVDPTGPLVNAPLQHPGWLEIHIDADSAVHEAVGSFLFDLGCEGIVTESFDEPSIMGYLPLPLDLEDIQNRIEIFTHDLEEIFPEAASLRFMLNRIENRDWSVEWRQFFKPARVTPGLLVTPAWEPVPSFPRGHVIRIDPGPAFGTGRHATTGMCLRAMEIPRFSGPWKMLDIGTGSGILAIYGAKLGAGRVAAIDTDPEALRWAKRNIELNNLSLEIELSSRPIEDWHEGFSLVTANLILGTILDLGPFFPNVLSPEAWLIVSGLLREQYIKAEEMLLRQGLRREYRIFQDEWACLVFRNDKDRHVPVEEEGS
jgi:ribosomal protein L11 methyltransferase